MKRTTYYHYDHYDYNMNYRELQDSLRVSLQLPDGEAQTLQLELLEPQRHEFMLERGSLYPNIKSYFLQHLKDEEEEQKCQI